MMPHRHDRHAHHPHAHPHLPWIAPPGFGDAPVGSVIAFAGALAPPAPTDADPNHTDIESWGWMACDGRTLVTQQYPYLFAALGYLYGGSGGSFAIPDYRGYFLRGTNAPTAIGTKGHDPDADARVPSTGGKDKGGVGSTQTSAIQMHEHAYDYAQDSAPSASGQGAAGTQTSKTLLTTGGPVKGGQEDGGDAVPTSLHETRPVNVYVTYIIKYSSNLTPFTA